MSAKPKYAKRQYRGANSSYVRKVAQQEAKKVVRKEIEVKEHDEINATTVSTTINNTNPIQSIVRGTDANDFIGDKINPVGLYINMLAIAGDSYNTIRFLVIQDKDLVGTPALSTVFENSTYPMTSALNTNYRHQYNVLVDKTLALTTNGGGGALPLVRRFYIKGKRLRQVRFNSTGNCNAGQLWIIMVSDSSTATHPSVELYTRLQFTDA